MLRAGAQTRLTGRIPLRVPSLGFRTVLPFLVAAAARTPYHPRLAHPSPFRFVKQARRGRKRGCGGCKASDRTRREGIRFDTGGALWR